MKFSSTLFTLVLAFASLTGLSQADPSAPPLPPAIFTPDHVENTWQWKLRAETIPGWLYSVEESQDLITWTTLPNSYFYGNGQQMSCYFCDGPPPADTTGSSGGTTTGTAGTSHVLKILFLTLRMQANGASSRFYLQREAAPAANIPGWDADLTDLLPPQPVGVRALYLMGWTDPNGTNTYWVDVQVIVEDAPPPVADPATSGEEAEELNVFQQIKSQIIARLLLPEEEAPEPTPSNSKFARIRRTAIDSNGNGYPDWYEIGNFPPGAQFAQIGSPLYVSGNVDTDNDGFTDAEEAAAGTDPNDATKHPPAVTRLVVLRRSAGENFSGNNGTYVDYINWPELKNYILWPAPARLIAAPTSFTATGSITPEQLSNHVTALRAFPGTPDPAPYLRLPMGTVTVAGSFTHKVTSLEDYSGTSPPTSYIEQSGNLEHLAVWLEHKPKETTPVTATFLAVPRQQLRIHGSPAGAMVTGIPEIVSFTIPAGQTLSNTSKELKPGFPEPPYENYSLDTQVSLIPVDIKTETIVTQPATRDRKKIGIGEEVKLTLASPADATVTWSMKSGEGTLGHPANYGPKEIQFNAGGKEESAEIEATLTNYQNAKVTVDFRVITPKTVFFEKVAVPDPAANGITIGTNPVGISMHFYADFYFGPDDVCFYNLVAGETGVPAHRTGSFLADPDADQPHAAWIGTTANHLLETVVVGKGTKGRTYDDIRLGLYPPPAINEVGRFEWNLEWKYRLKDGVGDGTPFAAITQWMEIIPGQGINGFTGKGGKGNVTVQ